MMLFEYRQEVGIPIEKIAESVTQMYYPFKDEQLHESLKKDIIQSLQAYTNEHGEIVEKKFIEVMKSIEGFANQKYHQKFLDKIFDRYDKDKDGFLNKQGFLKRIQ